jgi:hypothetical protein
MGAQVTPKPAPPLPANIAAAQTAVDVGQGLPAGIVSGNPAIRATTQAVRQLPLVGPKISEGVNKTIEATGEHIKDLSESLKGGAEGRADVGEVVRPGLTGMIEDNKAAMSAEYDALRGMIDPAKEHELPATKAALDRIVTQRQAAKMTNPMTGLENIGNLAEQGAGFEGLQRARSDFARKTQFGEPHPGYNEGERKFLHGAMSRDMENIVRQQGGEEAVGALKQANVNASQYIEQNRLLQQLVNKRSDESLAGSLIRAANKDTGDIRLLAQLRQAMPPEQFQTISGQLLGELGHNAATGEFSLHQFTTNWNKLSPAAKDVLFDRSHKQTLDGIANLGKFLKGGEQYKGHSNTGHAVGWLALLEHFGEVLPEAATGNLMPLAKTAAGVAGGYAMGRMLARPATASAVARWTRAAQAYSRAPSIRNRVAVNIATRNLANNIGDLSRFLGKSSGPKASEANSNQPPANRGRATDRLKIDIPAQPNR